MYIRLSYFIIAILVISNSLHSQELRQQPQYEGLGIRVAYTVYLTRDDSVILLRDLFIVTGSVRIVIDGSVVLEQNIHYAINYRWGRLTILALPDRLHTEPNDSVRIDISYRYLPLSFRNEYRLYEFAEDTLSEEEERIVQPTRPLSFDDIFTPGLQASGSLIRGLNIGTNRDLSLQSGFRMQLSGKLSENIGIVATLTDENTPIQPEGTTQTLRELDKVFIQISGLNAEATLGDFDFRISESEFGRVSRRLQGAMGTYSYTGDFTNGNAIIAGATMRGKFNTNEFHGAEGVQGPYRLTGRNNERAIIIVPGSERVYIDGIEMVRGETNDYTIEYGNGEVFFTAQRLITSASRIVVDFEYSDRQYPRNFFATGTKQKWFDDLLSFTIGYMREGDDRDSPIDITLGDEEKQILVESGNDRFKASRSSVRFVGVDTTTGRGNGQYVERDTNLNGETYIYYIFDPGTPDAIYSIGFSYVGEGQGSYRRIAAGQFEWMGPGNGTYLPVQFLPLPQLHQVLNSTMQFTVSRDISLFGEYSFSSLDRNRFSGIDDEFNNGGAYLIGTRYNPRSMKLFGIDIGSLDLQARQRFVGTRYAPLDRINDIEFNRQWNIEEEAVADEIIREASALYKPIPTLSLKSSYGRMERGNLFQSDRFDGLLEYTGSYFPKTRYYIESISSSDAERMRDGSWLRQRGTMQYDIGAGASTNITPGLEFEHEDRQIASISTDSLLSGSFAFYRFVPRLSIDEFAGMSLSTEFEFRNDKEFLRGDIVPESHSFTSRSVWRLRDWKSLSSRMDFTYRKKFISEDFRQVGRGDAETILIRSQTRFAPLRRAVETDLFYEVTTQRSARLERVFVRVPQGTGNYRYLGDLNNNGIADENEFELVRFDGDYIVVTVPTDELFPVVDLRSSIRFRLTPARLIQSGNGIVGEAVRLLSSETYIRMEEKSRDPVTSNIYLLRFSTFQNEDYTIAGSRIFTQDVFVNEQSREFSLRFRYVQRRGMNLFSLGVERSDFIERSVRLRWQLVEEIGHQVDFINRRDNVLATQPSNRERSITSNGFVSDLMYRPYPRMEAGFILEVTIAEDVFPVNPITANINAQTLRFVYSMQARGQLRVEFSRELIALRGQGQDADTRYSLPFELTGGRVEGLSWLWRAAFDYRISRFIQSTFQYDGRTEQNRPTVHQGRAEVRVFF
jgi:hypothetical protein